VFVCVCVCACVSVLKLLLNVFVCLGVTAECVCP